MQLSIRLTKLLEDMGQVDKISTHNYFSRPTAASGDY